MDELSINLNTLSPELTDIVFAQLSTSTLCSLRLVNHHLSSIATRWAFRHVRLGAREGHSDHENFVKIALSERLQPHVREVICDTWLGQSIKQDETFNFNIPNEFLKALPLLQCFRNLKALHLRFSQRTKHIYTSGSDAEPDDFRYRVLDTVFSCLAGTWTVERQERLDKELFGHTWATHDLAMAFPDMDTSVAIPIREFTVANLADFDDKRLTGSDVFRDVISMGSLTSLKLCIAQQEVDGNNDDERQPESAIWFREKYDMFGALPHTWLSASIAANLQVLSLYSTNYWGFNPRMDFRAILPGNSPDCGLPQLKVLALGMYVFSYDWQFDWIASLGQMNGSGGLEEVYLDRCAIMVQARHLTPANDGTGVSMKDSEENSNDAVNEGPYLIGGMSEDDASDSDITVEDFSVRWHQALLRMQEKMKALKIFKMGYSSQNSVQNQIKEAWWVANAPKSTGKEHLNHLLNNNFRDFDRPSPPSLLTTHRGSRSKFSECKPQAGINDAQRFQARYIYFDINSRPSEWRDVYWPSTAYPKQPQLEDDIRTKDMEALANILGSLDNRIRG
ncbi:hypothetical protein BGZ63DRAFT_391001 [Mariannaea sp. PMI_226]|nr:hypothetical protein BGZ63DRAFT_391001 [Mariannaea sp. PMI_226]